MVVVDTIGAIAIGGYQEFTWLLVLFVFFFIPSALSSAELGAALPEEGGAYVRVRRAFGRYPAGVASLLYWAGTPMWLGGSVMVVALAVFGRFLGHLNTVDMYVFGTVFIAMATIGAIVPLRIGKWVPTSGALTQIAQLLFFTATVVLYGIRHGTNSVTLSSFSPSYHVFIAVVPILLYSFVGIELPTSAAEEMVDPRRDIPAAIGRAGIGQLVMCAIPILAVLLVVPPARLTSLHGLIAAMQMVFTVCGGSVGAHGQVTPQRRRGGRRVDLRDRVHLDSAGERLGVAHRCRESASRRVPGGCRSGLAGSDLQAQRRPRDHGARDRGLALLTMFADLAFTSGNGQRYFSASLSVAVSLIVLAYLIIFPTFLALRIREPLLERPFRVSGGRPVAWLITALATGWSMLAALCILWPGFGTPRPDEALPLGFAGDRMGFELLVLGPIALLLIVHTCFYIAHNARHVL